MQKIIAFFVAIWTFLMSLFGGLCPNKNKPTPSDPEPTTITEESTAPQPETTATPVTEPVTTPETTAPAEPTTQPEEPATTPEEPTTQPEEPTTQPEEPVTAPEETTTEPTTVAQTYEVVFVNEDGSVLQRDTLTEGETPAYTGETPTRAATAQYTYAFAGWDRALAAVTENTTYTAVFTATVNTYAVTFKNADGAVLETKQVAYGETPTYTGATPTKAGTIRYAYNFAGWNQPLAAVTGAASYTATFNQSVKEYEVETALNISYGSSSSQVLDMCFPKGVEAYDDVGFLFYVHSGAWTGGSRSEAYSLCVDYAKQGYITATMDYRLLKENSTISAYTMMYDMNYAIAKAKTEIEARGIKTSKIALYGYSAGAHLVMLYATTQASVCPYQIAFVVDRAGPVDMDISKWTHLMQSYNMGFNTTELKEYIGQLAGNKSEFTKWSDSQLLLPAVQDYLRTYTDKISPAKNVTANVAPTIMCYGGKEILVLTDQRDALISAYNAAGARYDFIDYPNSYHGLESDPASEAKFQETLKRYFETYIGY